MAPFLEILTRTGRRPTYFARCQASVDALESDDYVHTLRIDEEWLGWRPAQQWFGEYAPELVGQYVYILDDDDVLKRPTFVDELKYIAAKHDPDVIWVRFDHGPYGVFPPRSLWGKAPRLGKVGISAYVLRRETFQAYADVWASGDYQCDFYLADALYNDGSLTHYWHDVIAAGVQDKQHQGASEEEILCELER